MNKNIEKLQDMGCILTPRRRLSDIPEDADIIELRSLMFQSDIDLRDADEQTLHTYLDFPIHLDEGLKFDHVYVTDDFAKHITLSDPADCTFEANKCQFQKKFKIGFNAGKYECKGMVIENFSVTKALTVKASFDLTKCEIDSFDDMSGRISLLTLARCDRTPSFKKLPDTIEAIELYVDHEYQIPKNILHVFMMPHLQEFSSNKDNDIIDIVEKCFANKQSIYDCASELIAHGFEKYTEL